ncbi:TolC family protein [Thiolapillus sp.]|uniref:TolC family protein n=2 Tax=Thiolapillus sp. TaxID=2017437 RepID=UPI0026007449|nr:TolC family protein [Thiolapillus sp.]
MGRLLFLTGVFLLFPAVQADPLPQPLSLSQALQLVDEEHPAIRQAVAREAAAEAELLAEESDDDLWVTLEGRLKYLEPAELSNFQDNNDSRLDLWVEKRLYDFGYTEARQASARASLDAAKWSGLNERQRQQLRVMQAFLDVLLADLEYVRDNEAVAIAYVRFDRFRNQAELGKLSDVDLLEKQVLYEKILSRRTATEARQRTTRLRLALALNRPGEIPADLVSPPAPDMDAVLPPQETLAEKVLQNNTGLRALRQKITAAEQKLAAAGKRYGPVIRGELGAHGYARETRSTEPFSAALVLEMSLYSGGRDDAETARARAELMENQALKAKLELELRQQVLELWLEQNTLRRRLKELRAREEYRDLYLDRSRTLYELERTSDLGDAMVQVSAVRLELAKLQYQWMLNDMRLKVLTGEWLLQ